MADEALMARVCDGDVDAFEVIFDRHADVVYSLAYRMCGRPNLAEDVAQEAFLSLWHSGTRYQPERGNVRSWLLGIVRNRAIDTLRRDPVRAGRDVNDDAAVGRLHGDERTEAEAERREDAAVSHSALANLPAEQGRVIELAFFGGLSHREIAGLLELPVGTVKGRMRLGLSKLHAALRAPAESIQ